MCPVRSVTYVSGRSLFTQWIPRLQAKRPAFAGRVNLTPRQHAEILLGQDDVGSVFRHIDRAIDRNANIGSVQRGGVVDPVTEVGDDMAAVLEGEDDAVLLNRGYPAEQVRFFEPRAERLIQLQTPIIRVPDATENHVRKLPSRCKPVSLMNDPGTLDVDQA
jgi:hypothetical protein